jgi:hypothetical protein
MRGYAEHHDLAEPRTGSGVARGFCEGGILDHVSIMWSAAMMKITVSRLCRAA